MIVILLAIILVPFVLFEETFQNLVDRLVTPDWPKPVVAISIASLLALDVFLPLPSSIVSTAAGALLGFAMGVAVSTAGMTAGCVMGYVCGYKLGPPAVRRLTTSRQLEQVSALFQRHSDWALVMMRPIPVLAEASAMVAGLAAISFPRFLSITLLANTGISVVYCFAGARAVTSGSFLYAFGGAIVFPACMMALREIWRRRQS